jgi:bifunctional N-acetylglucosamine-1-phosphate-uridyltransferase/glucosamine-1-phosphate-acetyltransferase GlmU-like protein
MDIMQNAEKKNLNTIGMLTSSSILRERNGRVFRNESNSIQRIVEQIKTDARHWAEASEGLFLLNLT